MTPKLDLLAELAPVDRELIAFVKAKLQASASSFTSERWPERSKKGKNLKEMTPAEIMSEGILDLKRQVDDGFYPFESEDGRPSNNLHAVFPESLKTSPA
jgi:hypothetical protein